MAFHKINGHLLLQNATCYLQKGCIYRADVLDMTENVLVIEYAISCNAISQERHEIRAGRAAG